MASKEEKKKGKKKEKSKRIRFDCKVENSFF